MDALRRLPFVIRPLPDEPLESWLEIMAVAHDATLRELVTAVGLVPPGRPWTSNQSNLGAWSALLRPEQIRALARTTGLRDDQIVGMTRINYTASVARVTRSGRISVSSASGGNAGRYCPECLADSGGRWRLSWQFQFGFACPRHRIILIDDCPDCATPPRRLDAPSASIPSPGHCHNRTRLADGTSERCGFDLRTPNAQPAAAEVLQAQRTILRTLSAGAGNFGIYADNPQPAIRIFADLALLTRLTRTAHGNNGAAPHPATPTTASAADSAAAVLALCDPDRIVQLLSELRSAPQYAAHTAQLQQLIAAARGHARGITTMIRTAAHSSAADPADRAQKVPAVFWDEWTDALVPRRLDREVAGGALAAAVVFAGTHLTHAAALELLDPGERTRRITHVMRDLDQTKPAVVRALGSLAAYLDERPPPIDYARRRGQDYTVLLPRSTWVEICDTLNVSPGSDLRWSLARASLYRRLSGNRIDRAPFETPATITAPALARFWQSAPPDVLLALEHHATRFLAERGIAEPIVWRPPLAIGGLPNSRPAGSPGRWPAARPARAKLGEEVSAEYRGGRSLRAIAAEHGIARQTVSRALGAHHVPVRTPGRSTAEINVEWLRRRYLDDRRTLREIADETGVTLSTISRYLRRAGIPARPRGSGSHAAALRPDPIANSTLLRRVLVGGAALQRAERFLIVANHATQSAAAAEIGIAPSVLAIQMARLEADAGGPLMIRADIAHEQELTALGRTLATELRERIARLEDPERSSSQTP